MPSEKRITLENHNTGEVIDISDVPEKELTAYLEDLFKMKVHYYRVNYLEDGTQWIDFGLYNWFIYDRT